MADFNTALLAKRALAISVESIFADTSLTEAARVDVLRKNVTDYAEYMRLPLADAEASVTKLMSGAGAPSAIIMKVAPKEQRRRGHLPASPEDEPSTTPDPALFTARLGPVRRATKAEALSLMRAAVAAGVAKIQEETGLPEQRARERWYGENPGIRKELVRLSGREYGQRGPSQQIAKQERVSSAQIEAAAKAAEIMNAEPRLSEHQALARAYAQTPGLMKRLLAERSGVQADG